MERRAPEEPLNRGPGRLRADESASFPSLRRHLVVDVQERLIDLGSGPETDSRWERKEDCDAR
jgi:hypothetical protein